MAPKTKGLKSSFSTPLKPVPSTSVARKPAIRSAPLRRSARISVKPFHRPPPLLNAGEPVALSDSSAATARSPSSSSVSPLTSSIRRAVDELCCSPPATLTSVANRSSSDPHSPRSIPTHSEVIPLPWFHSSLAREKFLTQFISRPLLACDQSMPTPFSLKIWGLSNTYCEVTVENC